MSVILSILLLLLPTISVLPWVDRKIGLSSKIGTLAVSWFLGQFFLGFFLNFTSCLLGLVTSSVLYKACLIWIFIFLVTTIIHVKRGALAHFARNVLGEGGAYELFYLSLAILFSRLLYGPLLIIDSNTLYRSAVYWDFTAHFSRVQSFAFGDNFPARSEVASGLPLLYHYFHDLLIASHCAVGLDIPNAFLIISVATLTALIVLVAATTELFFNSRVAGMVAGIFLITSGSLRWIYELGVVSHFDVFRLFKAAWYADPYGYSLRLGPPLRYNGNMFNLFYFLEERHLVFACAIPVIAILLLRIRDQLTTTESLVAGVSLGATFYWHAYASLLPGISIGAALMFRRARTKTILIFFGYLATFLACCLVFKMKGEGAAIWFRNTEKFLPFINGRFSSINAEIPFSVEQFFWYWFIALGCKWIFAIVGMQRFYRQNRELAVTILLTIGVTFALINTVQLMPNSIYENHKWLKPMMTLMDILAAGGLVTVCSWWLPLASLGLPFVIATSLSGVLEGIPYLNSRDYELFAPYPSNFIDTVRRFTFPKSSILTRNPREILLAGRTCFDAPSASLHGVEPVLSTLKFDYQRRQSLGDAIYRALDIRTFCRLVNEAKVDYVEFSEDEKERLPFTLVANRPRFDAYSELLQEQFTYVDVTNCSAMPL